MMAKTGPLWNWDDVHSKSSRRDINHKSSLGMRKGKHGAMKVKHFCNSPGTDRNWSIVLTSSSKQATDSHLPGMLEGAPRWYNPLDTQHVSLWRRVVVLVMVRSSTKMKGHPVKWWRARWRDCTCWINLPIWTYAFVRAFSLMACVHSYECNILANLWDALVPISSSSSIRLRGILGDAT